MTQPLAPIIKEEGGGHRFALHPVTHQRVPGVTSVIGLINKPFLLRWAANMSAEYAIDNLADIVKMALDGRKKEAEHLIGGASTRYADEASNLGTEVHNMYETLGNGDDVGWQPLRLSPYLKHFESFNAEYSPVFLKTEAMFWHPELNYFGSGDAIADLTKDGETVRALLDYKSGAGVYSSVALQLAAYAHAPYIVELDGTLTPNYQYDTGLAFHTRPEGYSLHPVDISEEVFDVFKLLLKLNVWERETSKGVISKPDNASPYRKPRKEARYPK